MRRKKDNRLLANNVASFQVQGFHQIILEIPYKGMEHRPVGCHSNSIDDKFIILLLYVSCFRVRLSDVICKYKTASDYISNKTCQRIRHFCNSWWSQWYGNASWNIYWNWNQWLWRNAGIRSYSSLSILRNLKIFTSFFYNGEDSPFSLGSLRLIIRHMITYVLLYRTPIVAMQDLHRKTDNTS